MNPHCNTTHWRYNLRRLNLSKHDPAAGVPTWPDLQISGQVFLIFYHIIYNSDGCCILITVITAQLKVQRTTAICTMTVLLLLIFSYFKVQALFFLKRELFGPWAHENWWFNLSPPVVFMIAVISNLIKLYIDPISWPCYPIRHSELYRSWLPDKTDEKPEIPAESDHYSVEVYVIGSSIRILLPVPIPYFNSVLCNLSDRVIGNAVINIWQTFKQIDVK